MIISSTSLLRLSAQSKERILQIYGIEQSHTFIHVHVAVYHEKVSFEDEKRNRVTHIIMTKHWVYSQQFHVKSITTNEEKVSGDLKYIIKSPAGHFINQAIAMNKYCTQ